jgi:hypothetical protein
MIKQTSTKQNKRNNEKKIKNDTKTKKKQTIKSTNLNSKRISNKPKPKSKSTKSNLTKSKKNIVVERSSGRNEKFDTDRLAQTVSRSGVSFPVARDVAKSVTKKIKKSVQNKSTGSTKKKQQQQKKPSSIRNKQKLKAIPKKEQEPVIVTADQIKNLVQDEIKNRNQQDHTPSFSDNTTLVEEPSIKTTLNDIEPVIDNVAANKNKILYDPSKQKGSS